MPKVDPVILQLKAEIAGYRRDLSNAQSLTNEKLGAIERRGVAMGDNIGASMKRMAGILAGAFTVREIAGLLDKAKQLDAQLKLATSTSGNFAKAQEDVRRIAALTRSELDAVGSLYGNFQRNAKELGITQDQVARATQTVAETFKISGASSQEASQGIRQLTQGLQSGVLRGDEFNTMMESSPRLARLLAESLGVPIGQLRKMAEEGELTSDKLVRAFTDTKFTAGLDAEFRQLPVTFDQALTQIENAAIVVFGAFDKGGQFSNAIVGFVGTGVDGFAQLESAAESFGRTVSAELAGVIAIAGNLIGELKNLAAQLDYVVTLGGQVQGGGILERLDPLYPLKQLVTNSPAYLNAKNAQSNKLTFNSVISKATSSLGGDGPAGAPRPVAPKRTGGAKKPSGAAAANAAARLVEQGLREGSNLDSDVLRAQIDLATNAQERADLEKQALEQERAELVRSLTARKLLTSGLLDKVNQLYGTPSQTDAQGNTVVDGKPGLLAQKITRELEQREAAVRNDTMKRELDVLDAWTELETNTQERNKMEQAALALQQDIQKNLLEQEIATGRIADAETARAQLSSLQEAGRERMLRNQRTPGQKYVDGLRESAGNINEAIDNIKIAGLESLNDGLTEAIMGAKSLGDVFKGVANQIIADLIRIAIQKTITTTLADSLFGGGGGGGIFGSLFGGGGKAALKLAGARASGGPVGQGKAYLVGERGPEIFVPSSNGGIIPNGGGGGQSVVQVHIMEGQLFEPRVQAISGDVSVQVVRAAAPSIVDASARETMARAKRPRI